MKPGIVFVIFILGLLVAGCADQPATTATPGGGLPAPSTPGPGPSPAAPTPTDDPAPLPAPTYLVLPAPTPSRTAAPAPVFSGKLPDLSRLPQLPADPSAARPAGQFSGRAISADGKPEPLRAVAISPDLKLLALADRSEIWIIELANGRLLQSLTSSASNPEEAGAHSLAWSPDGKLLAAGGLSGIITMWRWDGPTGRFRKGAVRLAPTPLSEAFGDTVEVAFSPDSKRLAGFGSDGSLSLYNTDTYQLQAGFGSDFAGYLAWSPDGRRLADEFLLLHYPDSGRTVPPHEKLPVAADGPQGVAWSPDGRLIAVSGNSFELLLVEAPALPAPGGPEAPVSTEVKRVAVRATAANPNSLPHLKEGRRVAWAPSGRWVAVANVPEAGQVSLYGSNGVPLFTLNAGPEILRALVWPHDSLLITAGHDGAARLWQLESAAPASTPAPASPSAPTPTP